MFSLLKSIFSPSSEGQLKDAIRDGAYLIDVRTPAEFSSGSVEGAINIPLDKLPAHFSNLKGKDNIVVFCRSGARSAQAAEILIKNGFKNVINGRTRENILRYIGQEV